jgi:hypothetical protein
VSAAQSVQVAGRSDSVDPGGISGTEAQMGAADDVGARSFGAESEAAPRDGIPRPRDWQERSRRAKHNWSRKNVWNGQGPSRMYTGVPEPPPNRGWVGAFFKIGGWGGWVLMRRKKGGGQCHTGQNLFFYFKNSINFLILQTWYHHLA